MVGEVWRGVSISMCFFFRARHEALFCVFGYYFTSLVLAWMVSDRQYEGDDGDFINGGNGETRS